MNGSSYTHQVKYILWIRSEYERLSSLVSRGSLETVAGQKFVFNSLAELDSLLCEMGGWIDPPPLANDIVSVEANKSLVRQYIEQVLNEGKFQALDELLSPIYKRYLSTDVTPLTSEAQKKRLAGLRAAFPDMQVTIDDMIAEGNRIAYRATVHGTHQGVFQGIQPKGKPVTVAIVEIIRIENGRFVEHWGGPDTLSLLQQLGALP